MEKSFKDIVIDDMGTQHHFRIKLFDAEAGLDFVETYLNAIKSFQGTEKTSIKMFLKELLPLAAMLDVNGTTVVNPQLDLPTCYSIFQNPLSVLELGLEIMSFQEVFIKNSKVFRPLMDKLGNMSPTRILE